MKILLTTFALFCFMSFSNSQTLIPGTLNISNVIPNVERDFAGFNNFQGGMDPLFWKGTSNSSLRTCDDFYDVFNYLGSNISFRFPGGMLANDYNRWNSGYGNFPKNISIPIFPFIKTSYFVKSDAAYLPANISISARDAVYGGTSPTYNYYTTGPIDGKSNCIFPFISTITHKKDFMAKSNFVINILNHYRNYSYTDVGTLQTKQILISDSTKIKSINNLYDFNTYFPSGPFRDIVIQNLDAFKTLVQNNIYVENVELGNELFNAIDTIYANGYCEIERDFNYFISSNGDRRIWNSKSNDNSYNRSLILYAHLARMYKILIKETLLIIANSNPSNPEYMDMYNNIKFGVPLASRYSGLGLSDIKIRVAADFFLRQDIKNYIGIDAYIEHPYAGITITSSLSAATNNNTTTLTTEFNNLRDDIAANYFNDKMKNKFIQNINLMPPNTEWWPTEWNLGIVDGGNQQKLGNTLLHAMFYFDEILSFFDINANKNLLVSCNKSNPIASAKYHAACHTSGITYNFVRFPNYYQTTYIDPLTTTNSNPNDVKYNSPYYAHMLLSPILEDGDIKYLDNTNGGFTSVSNCLFRTFNKSFSGITCNYNYLYIYFDNKSGQPYKVDLTALGGFNGNCIQSASKSYLYANNLFASMGKTTFRTSASDDILTTNPNITIQRVFNENVSTYNNVEIPPYSIGYVRVNILVPNSNPLCACGSSSGRMAPKNEKDNEKTNGDIDVLSYTNGDIVINTNNEILGNISLKIFSVDGKLIESYQYKSSGENSNFKQNLSGLTKGVYIINLETDKKMYSKKIVVP